jgi:murein DD-endopeptidase MepM/ murein hydrolase activator NlpD
MDATPYDLGATPYEAPDTVIFSDRSSGCQVVLNGDQGLNSNPCTAGSETMTTADNSASEDWGSASGTTSATFGSGRSSSRSLGWNASGLIPSYMGRYQSFLKRSGKGEINLLFPLSIPAAITSAFGWRIHPITGDQRFHAGTDLGAPSGTPVLAADAGQVSVAEVMGGYGLTVILSHKQDTVQTLYAHLSEILVQPGDRVKQGAVIGRVGSTGNSTGPHLHFEMQKFTPEGWIAVDPGIQLETAVAQLIKYLQTAQVKSTRTVS